MKLSYIVLAFTFFINIIALLKATENDIYFDLGRNMLYRLATGETVCHIKQLGTNALRAYKFPKIIKPINLLYKKILTKLNSL